jgi:hypothetical protein
VPSCSGGSLIDDFKKVTACKTIPVPRTWPTAPANPRWMGGNPTQANGWTTSSCLKVDEGAGGLSYLQSEADFAACEASKSTAANGVEIQCIKDGPHTVTVLQGEACIPGYNASTKKVTDCAGVGQLHNRNRGRQTRQLLCADLRGSSGQKKTYQGQYWSDRKAMTGTIETGTRRRVGELASAVTWSPLQDAMPLRNGLRCFRLNNPGRAAAARNAPMDTASRDPHGLWQAALRRIEYARRPRRKHQLAGRRGPVLLCDRPSP